MFADTAKNHIDMCQGPLFGKLVQFYFPLLGSFILQRIFNAADLIVVGRFASSEAMAAIGTTGSLTGLLINCFIGLSTGSNIIVAYHYGAKNERKTSLATHTAIAMSLICGLLIGLLFYFCSGPVLRLMSAPPDILELSTLYMKICSLGMPFLIIYNFGSAILRSVGDTRNPLIYLTIAGVINVVLNIIFVVAFHWDVAGVALATAISQAISAILVLRELHRTDDSCRLVWHKLAIDGRLCLDIIRVGLPAGIGSCCFSLSNIVIQATINTFGTITIAGNAIAADIENFMYATALGLHHTALTFTSQNNGQKLYARIKRTILLCLLLGLVVSNGLGLLCCLFGRQLMGIYTTSQEVIEAVIVRIYIMQSVYGLTSAMEISTGALRGLGYSLLPTLISLFFACIFRLLWIWLILPHFRTYACLIFSYPFSWAACAIVNFLFFYHIMRKRTQPLITVRT